MAEAFELAANRRYDDGENPSAEREWMVVGATGYANAYATLDAAIPGSITLPSGAIVYADGFEALEVQDEEAAMRFRVRYSSQPKPAANETEFEFDVSAPTQTVFQGLAVTAFAPSGKTAPNFGGAIGVQDGIPRGAQPLSAFSTFSITKHWPVASVNQAYQLTIESLIGSVCNATFNGRAAGTVRLLGVRGRQSGNKFPISYEFGFRPNVSSFAVDAITVTSANGWDIIDPYYEPQVDTTNKKLVRRARAVYVHRIHPLVSWAGLSL